MLDSQVLVSVFPARRIREALVLVSILALVVVFILIRVLRPEQLANADNFESVAAYMAQLQTPMPILTPPSWASDLLIASLFGRPFPWIDLSLLLSATSPPLPSHVGRRMHSMMMVEQKHRRLV